MRKLTLSLALLLINCDWPAWPGSSGMTCGTEFSDASNGTMIKDSLSAVFATENTIFAAGINGSLFILDNNKTIPTQCHIGGGAAPLLSSIFIMRNSIYYSGSNGIYRADLSDPCNAALLSGTDGTAGKNVCHDVWGTPDGKTAIASCEAELKVSTDGLNWSTDYTITPKPTFGATVVSGDATLRWVLAGSDQGTVFSKSLDGGSWSSSQSTMLPVPPRDAWVDADQFAYLVGSTGLFDVADLTTDLTTNPLMWSSLQPVFGKSPPPAGTAVSDWNLNSVWGSSVGGAQRLFVVGEHKQMPTRGLFWKGTRSGSLSQAEELPGNKRALGVHGNSRNVYVVGDDGMAGSLKGFILCRALSG